MNNKLSKKKFSLGDYFKFLIPSVLGVLLLMVPFQYQGKTTIFVALLASKLSEVLAGQIPLIVLIFIGISAILSLVFKISKPKEINRFNSMFLVSTPWVFIRLLGFVLAAIIFTKIGPEFIWSEDTGGLILYDLILGLFSIFLFAGFLLPLLTDFGLLELVGALLTPVMRPLFGLPGRSSIDCVASWVGDGTVGVALTNKQYLEGYYTKREAAVIATTFSAVSITFCLVVLEQVGLSHLFGPYYLTITLAGIVAAILMPKLPPLKSKDDTYYNNNKADLGEDVPEGHSNFSWGLELGIARANKSFNFSDFIGNGLFTVLDLWFGVLPAIVAFGTIGLIVAEYTSLFQLLGMPFIPLLKLLQIPYAQEASRGIMIGFADMFLPSVLGASIPSEMTRFVVATLSVTQLVYLSEAGAVILGSQIDISPLDLFLIYIERTLITLPVIAIAAHIIF